MNTHLELRGQLGDVDAHRSQRRLRPPQGLAALLEEPPAQREQRPLVLGSPLGLPRDAHTAAPVLPSQVDGSALAGGGLRPQAVEGAGQRWRQICDGRLREEVGERGEGEVGRSSERRDTLSAGPQLDLGEVDVVVAEGTGARPLAGAGAFGEEDFLGSLGERADESPTFSLADEEHGRGSA